MTYRLEVELSDGRIAEIKNVSDYRIDTSGCVSAEYALTKDGSAETVMFGVVVVHAYIENEEPDDAQG